MPTAFSWEFQRQASVSIRSAMQMTAVYSSVRILSEAVAGLPLHLYQYNDKSSKEKAVDSPLYFLLHDEPNTEMTSFVFRETLMTHLLLWSNAYSQIIRNGKGEVMGLYPLMPDKMAVNRDEKGRLYYEYMVSSDDAKTLKDGTVRLSPYDVLHIPGLGFNQPNVRNLKNPYPIGCRLYRRYIGTSISFEKGGRQTERFDTPDTENIIELNGIKSELIICTDRGANGMKTLLLWQAWQALSFMRRLSSCGLSKILSHGLRPICF